MWPKFPSRLEGERLREREKTLFARCIGTTILWICLSATPVLSSSIPEYAQLTMTNLIPVITKYPCIASIMSDPKESSNCLPWNRREKSGPLYDETRGLVFIGGSDAHLHVVSLRGDLLTRSVAVSGNIESKPLLVGQHLIFGTADKHIVSMNSESLAVSWNTELDAEIEESPVYFANKVYVVTGLATLYCLDEATGDVIWSRKRSISGKVLRIKSRPLLIETKMGGKPLNLAVIGHSSGRVEFIDAQSGELVTEKVIGNIDAPFPDVATDGVLSRGDVIMASFNKGISSLSLPLGNSNWDLAIKGVSRLAASRGMIFAAGGRFVVGIDALRGKVRWKYSFKRGAPTNLVLKDGRIYFGSDLGDLFVLDQRTGRPVKVLASDFGFAGDLDFSSDRLFALSTAGYLYEYSSVKN